MRWVLSPIIGNGTAKIVVGQEATTGPYRASASAYGGHVAIIPGNDDGTPKFNWCLCQMEESAAVAADAADPAITVFPALQLDDVLTLGQRNWLITKVGNLGKPTGWIVPGITVRECVRTIGRYLEDNFDVNWMSLG
jgi:hypothetical protein